MSASATVTPVVPSSSSNFGSPLVPLPNVPIFSPDMPPNTRSAAKRGIGKRNSTVIEVYDTDSELENLNLKRRKISNGMFKSSYAQSPTATRCSASLAHFPLPPSSPNELGDKVATSRGDRHWWCWGVRWAIPCSDPFSKWLVQRKKAVLGRSRRNEKDVYSRFWISGILS